MWINKVTTATVAGLATLLSVSVASATDFNKKEINGHSNYIGAANIFSSDVGDISFMENRDQSTGIRNGKKAGFDDPDGFLGSYGTDFGYVRVETEIGYRETDVTSLSSSGGGTYTGVSGAIDMGTAMINMAIEYSFDPGEMTGGSTSGIAITPFVTVGGGGLGLLGNLNYLSSDLNKFGEAQQSIDNGMLIAPAIQGGAGLTIGLPMGVEVYGAYSEMLAYTYGIKSSNDIHIKNVTGGLRVNF